MLFTRFEQNGMKEEEFGFPPSHYYLDESDPDILLLRRQADGTLVAAFSAAGATKESIVEAAREDYRASTSSSSPSFSLAIKPQPA